MALGVVAASVPVWKDLRHRHRHRHRRPGRAAGRNVAM